MTSTSAHRGCICQGLSAGCLAFAKKGASRVWRDARECDGNDGSDGRRTVRAGLGALVDALIAGKRGWAGDFSVNRTLGEGPWPLAKKLDSTRCNKVTVLDSLADPRNRNGCTGPLKEPTSGTREKTDGARPLDMLGLESKKLDLLWLFLSRKNGIRVSASNLYGQWFRSSSQSSYL